MAASIVVADLDLARAAALPTQTIQFIREYVLTSCKRNKFTAYAEQCSSTRTAYIDQSFYLTWKWSTCLGAFRRCGSPSLDGPNPQTAIWDYIATACCCLGCRLPAVDALGTRSPRLITRRVWTTTPGAKAASSTVPVLIIASTEHDGGARGSCSADLGGGTAISTSELVSFKLCVDDDD